MELVEASGRAPVEGGWFAWKYARMDEVELKITLEERELEELEEAG